MLTTLLLLACAPERTWDPENPIDLSELPRNTIDGGDGLTLDVYFTSPGTERDGGEDPILDDALIALIDAAEISIDACLFELDHPGIVAALGAAFERGVDLRMVGDGDEAGHEGYYDLEELGVPFSNRKPRDRIMHNKFVVVDGQVVWTGSTNATDNGVFRNNNNGVLIESSDLAAEYTAEFDQMFDGTAFGRKKDDVNGTNTVLFRDDDLAFYFSPEHNPIDDLVAQVDMADVSIRFAVFSFTHPDLSDALIRAQDRGVLVVGIFDESQGRGAYSKDETLALAGLPVYIDGNHNNIGFSGGKLHHKIMIIDAEGAEPRVVTGSFNWSKSGTHYNDENTLIVRDAAVVELFRREWCGMLDVATLHPDFVGEVPQACEAPASRMMLNEVLADPSGSERADEFIEVVNAGTSAVDLTGWTLSDGIRVRHTFDGVIVGPGEAAVVWSGGIREGGVSDAASTGALSLNNSGDLITFADATGIVVDTLEYGGSQTDVSWARAVDGDPESDWRAHDTVDGATQDLSPGTRVDGSVWVAEPLEMHLVINELLPNPTGSDLGQEFVEIVNVGEGPATMTGWSLGDLSSDQRHVFTDEVIPVGGALVIYDRGEHAIGVVSSSGQLSLNNGGDVVSLWDAGGDLHDQASYTSSSEGVSLNRAIDATAGLDMVDHDEISAADTSPGTYADGTPFEE